MVQHEFLVVRMRGAINGLLHGDGALSIVGIDAKAAVIHQHLTFGADFAFCFHALGQAGKFFLHLGHGVGAVGRHREMSHKLWLLLAGSFVETAAANLLLLQLRWLTFCLWAECDAVVSKDFSRAAHFLAFLFYCCSHSHFKFFVFTFVSIFVSVLFRFCFAFCFAFVSPDAPAAPLPSRGGVAVGRGGVCISSHTEENILTQRYRVTRGFYLTQRRGGILRFRRMFSEFWESFRAKESFRVWGVFQSSGSLSEFWGVSDRRSLSVSSVSLYAARGRYSPFPLYLCVSFLSACSKLLRASA